MVARSKIFFIIMFSGALFWVLYLSVIILEGVETNSWPETYGIIKSSAGERANHSKERYIVNVTYEYSVNGSAYLGENVAGSNKMLTRSELSEILKQYNPGKKVKVYFNPANHSEAYLVRGIDFGVLILYVACIGMLVLSSIKLISFKTNKV